jgi:geranyl-CoA carboxylase alpha subunit
MLAKFIAHGSDRADAIRRLRRALADAPLLGLGSNAGFLRALLAHPDFAAGTMSTTHIDAWAAAGDPILRPPEPSESAWAIAAAVLGGRRSMDLTLHCGTTQRRLRLPLPEVEVLAFDEHRLTVQVQGLRRRLAAVRDGATLHLAIDGQVFVFSEPSPWPGRADGADPARLCAPTAGTLVALKVAVGDRVTAGQPLACVEAMKMEMWLQASAAGSVKAVHRSPRSPVAAGDLIVELEIDDE